MQYFYWCWEWFHPKLAYTSQIQKRIEKQNEFKYWLKWQRINTRGDLLAGLFGSLNDYGNPFHKAARDVAEIPGNIINGPLLAKKYGMEKVE